MGLGSDEIFGGHWPDKIWHKEGSKGEVKWKKGLSAVSHVEGRIASKLTNGGMVSPEDVQSDCGPLCDVAIACLNEGFADGVVLPFHNSVHSRIVC